MMKRVLDFLWVGHPLLSVSAHNFAILNTPQILAYRSWYGHGMELVSGKVGQLSQWGNWVKWGKWGKSL